MANRLALIAMYIVLIIMSDGEEANEANDFPTFNTNPIVYVTHSNNC